MDNFNRIKKIGKGNFGDVSLVQRKSDNQVIITHELHESFSLSKESIFDNKKTAWSTHSTNFMFFAHSHTRTSSNIMMLS